MKVLLRRLLFPLVLAGASHAGAGGPECQTPGPGQTISLSGCQAGVHLVKAAVEPPPSKTVYMTTFSAQPDLLTVPVGTTVIWKNYDEITHSVVLPDARSDRLWAAGWGGKSFSKTFHHPGEYPFQCGVHNDVHGKIVVTRAGQGSSAVAVPTYPGHTLSGMPKEARATHPAAAHHEPMPAAATSVSHVAIPGAVTISNHAFAPVQIKVSPGSSVTWTNRDSSGHTIKFSDVNSSRLRQGDSYSRSFASPGRFDYSCGIHGYMKGTVLVGS